MKLGEMIAELEKCEPTGNVAFAELGGCPANLTSYRGYYDQLAWTRNERWSNVAETLAECRWALGRTMEGWKGGEYEMTADTVMWVAEPGECSGIAVISIEVSDAVWIHTADISDYA